MAKKKKDTTLQTTSIDLNNQAEENANELKYGYYKANICFRVTYEGKDYHIYGDDFSYSYYDIETKTYKEVTDKEELFKIWFKTRMNNKYIEKWDNIFALLKRINESVEFIGVE